MSHSSLARSLFPVDEKAFSAATSPVSTITTCDEQDVPPLSLSAPLELRLPSNARLYAMATKASAAVAIVSIFVGLLVSMAPTYLDTFLALDLQWSMMIAGFLAQLVDGSLGMGYGITSATVLTMCGLSPTAASSAVHLAQLGTTAVSGYSHHKCGNTCGTTLRPLTAAGVVGAFIGSTLLSSMASKTSKLVSCSVLLAVGMYVLVRFARAPNDDDDDDAARGAKAPMPAPSFLAPLGLVGGIVDAVGGGGWGPVATSGLLAQGGLPPSTAIGTVSLSEFFVTVSAVLGFHVVLGASAATGDAIKPALMLLAGGLLAAPIAPCLVQRVKPRRLGMLVGGFICLTNVRIFF